MDQIFKVIITIGNSLVISFIIWYIPYKLRRMEDKLEEINKRQNLPISKSTSPITRALSALKVF